MTQDSPRQLELGGIQIHDLSKAGLVDWIVETAVKGEPAKVYNVNINAMNLAAEIPAFRESLNTADLVFCDGFGVKLGARINGIRIRERLAVMDWIDLLLEKAIQRDLSLFLIGDEAHVVRKCAERMRQNHNGLKLVGTHHGYFDKDGAESRSVCELVRESSPQVLLVGFGMPLQEFWIDANLHRLGDVVAIPVGATFTWYSDTLKRAPVWMSSMGMEWFYRLAIEPRKLWRRYLLGNPRFIIRMISSALLTRIHRHPYR